MLTLKSSIAEGEYDDICVTDHKLYALQDGNIQTWNGDMEKSTLIKGANAKFISSSTYLYTVNGSVSAWNDGLNTDLIVQPDAAVTGVFKVGSCVAVCCQNGKVFVYCKDEFLREFDTSKHSTHKSNIGISYAAAVFPKLSHKITDVVTINTIKEYLLIGNESGEVFVFFEGDFHSLIQTKPWGLKQSKITCIYCIDEYVFVCTKSKAVIIYKHTESGFDKCKTLYNMDGYVRQIFSFGINLYVLTSSGALIAKHPGATKWNLDRYIVMGSAKSAIFNEKFQRAIVLMDGPWGKGLFMFGI